MGVAICKIFQKVIHPLVSSDYKTKLDVDGSIHKHKARMIVKGHGQSSCVYYSEVFASVARHDTIQRY